MRLITISEEASWPAQWASQCFSTERFRNWLHSLGIKGAIGSPMSGNVGRAYPVGTNHIIKFTVDRNEANAAAALKGHNSKHAADVYDVRRVGTFQDQKLNMQRTLYVIAMERLNTGTGTKIRTAGNAVYSYLDHFSGLIENPKSTIKVVMDRFVPKKYRHDETMKALVTKTVNALYDVQEKTGVLSQDPHGGNMALKDRNIAFFDFGRSNINRDHAKPGAARISQL